MNFFKKTVLHLGAGIGMLLPGLFFAQSTRADGPQPESGPAKVELRQQGDRWSLLVNHKPFYVKGAGIELGSPEKLRAHGGNSLRTWSTDNGRDSGKAVLDRALTNGLYVAMGLDVDHERRGFDYGNPEAVARQLSLLKSQVLEYRNHPALLLWVVGNELNFEKNPRVWDAVDELSRMIHRVDPNHLTTTTLAGFNCETVDLVRQRASDLDFVSFQMYCDIINLPKYLHEAGWKKPYLVTEWGATGHWECGKTAWGAPLENDSATKADLYEKRFREAIQSDQQFCLGSYVFLWGNKQERTPTWYGMFLGSGEETAAVDVMHRIWTGKAPRNRSPRLIRACLNEKTAAENISMVPGQACTAQAWAVDPDQDSLTYHWEVMAESEEKKVGGDPESKPAALSSLILDPNASAISLHAPGKPGAYRLFAYVFDGKGHAAHVNIPFQVQAERAAPRVSASVQP